MKDHPDDTATINSSKGWQLRQFLLDNRVGRPFQAAEALPVTGSFCDTSVMAALHPFSVSPPPRLLVGLVGSAAAREQMRDWIPEPSTVVGFDSIEGLPWLTGKAVPAILVVALEWPDQYAFPSVARLFDAIPETRIVCVLWEWSASMNRTREAWPFAAVVTRELAAERIAREFDVCAGEALPLPYCAGREEVVEWRETHLRDPGSRTGRVDVISPDPAIGAWLVDTLASAGFNARVADDSDQGADRVIIDGDPWTLETADRVRRNPRRCLVLTSDLMPACHPAAGDVPVMSKYAPADGWFRALVAVGACLLALLEGCGSRIEPRPRVAKSANSSWDQQVAAVREGKQKLIVTDESLTSEDWAALKTGCASLEVLETGRAEIMASDLDFVAATPRLRRFASDAPIGDAEAEALAKFPALAELNLPHSVVTDKGLTALCGLPLRQLRLGSPAVTDEGIAALKNLRKLRFLHLIDVPITDAALPDIAGIESLQSFYLDGGRCTEEALGKLVKKRRLHFHLDQMHLEDDPDQHPH